MRIRPLVGTKSGHNEESGTDQNVCSHHVQPNIHRQGAHEAEESSGRTGGHLEENTNAQVHERLGEVNHILTGKVDRQRSYCKVRFLLKFLFQV